MVLRKDTAVLVKHKLKNVWVGVGPLPIVSHDFLCLFCDAVAFPSVHWYRNDVLIATSSDKLFYTCGERERDTHICLHGG